MTFKIEFSDQRFRVVAPDGEYEEAVGYCTVSTVEYEGIVYGAYLNGDEAELEELAAHSTLTIMPTEGIKVYNLSNWPSLESMDTEIEEIEFDEDEPAAEGPTVDVVPIA
jgi:hypothetical protein